jgi:CelD/BcsL family acetyltransferase involved in cellulose biosynthesis
LRVGVTGLRDAGDQLVGRWRDLAATAAAPNPFAHPDFVLPAALALEDGADAALVHVSDENALVFALPVVRRRRYRRLPISTIATWRHPYCFLGGPLVADLDARAAWGEVLRHLRHQTGFGLLALELLPVEPPGLLSLEQALPAERLSASTYERLDRPVIERRPHLDYFDAQMSSKRRKNLRRQRRHLDTLLDGTLQRFDWAQEERALSTSIELFLRLERAGWKGKAGTAIACRPDDEAFFRVMVDRFARAGLLQLWFLEAGGTPVAAQCNLLGGDTVFHFKIAYDEDYATYSPGVLLELEMVEEFHLDQRLLRIDSCAAPGSMYETLYPNRRTLASALVPLHGSARAAAPALAAALRRRERRADAGAVPAGDEA